MPEKDKKEEVEETDVEETEEAQEEEASEEITEEEEDLDPAELKSRLDKTKADLRKANREAKERRLALEKLEQEKKDREEAELSEKEKAEKRATEAEEALAKLRSENHSLKLSQEFDRTAGDLKLEFVSQKARDDALRLLDLEKVGDDFDGLEDELKSLAKDRPYLFGKPDPNQFINDGSRKTRQGSHKTPTRKIIENKKRSISPL